MALDQNSIKIWLRCTWFHQCSWTAVHKGLLKALRRQCDVTDLIEKPPSADVELIVGDADQLHWNSESAFRVGYTIWEARSFPESRRDEIIRRAKMADLLLIASEAAAVAFRELPIETPVEVVPLGYDPEEFYPTTREWGLGHKVKFLLAGVVQPRKGSWLALEAFEMAFPHSRKVELTVWSVEKQPMLIQLEEEYAGHKRIRFDEDRVPSTFDVLKQHHVLLSPHISEGYGLCLRGDTLVTSPRGVKPIRDIVVGDFVLGADGIFEEVVGKNSRSVGEIREITVRGCEPIGITVEHPFAIWEEGSITWKEADAVEKGDMAVLPLVARFGDWPDRLDICDYIDSSKYICEDDCVYSVWGFSPHRRPSIRTICDDLGYPKYIVERALRQIDSIGAEKTLPHYRYIQSYALLVGYKKPQPVRVKRSISLDRDFLTFVGWYLAEGSSNPQRSLIEFSLGSTEMEIAEFLKDYTKRTFGVKAAITKVKGKKVIRVSIGSSPLAELMTALCGDGAQNKRIHPDLFVYVDKLLPLALAFIAGDGCVSEVRRTVSCATISGALAYQIRHILMASGFWVTLKKYPPQELGRHDVYQLNARGNAAIPLARLMGYEMEFRRNNSVHKFVELDGKHYIIVPVRSNKKIQGRLLVYNIETANTHTYVANNLLVHNCIPEAMATGMPCIVSRCSAPLEFFNAGSGCWIEMTDDYMPVQFTDFDVPGFWRLPSLDSLVENMREVVKHPRVAKQKGAFAASYAAKSLTWDHSANKLLSVIRRYL